MPRDPVFRAAEERPRGGCPECGWPDRSLPDAQGCWRRNLQASCRRTDEEAGFAAPITPRPAGWGSSRWGSIRRRLDGSVSPRGAGPS